MSNEAQAEQVTYCALSIHNDDYPEGTVVYDPESLQLKPGALYLLAPRISNSAIQDFQRSASVSANLSTKDNDGGRSSTRKWPDGSKKSVKTSGSESHADLTKAMVFVAQPLQPNAEHKRKLRGMQVNQIMRH